MPNHIELGKKGEQLAIDYLQSRGFGILDCNFRFKRAEVDIIASYKGVTSFIEVKTRNGKGFHHAENAIGKTKQELFFQAAQEYCRNNPLPGSIQFDVMVIEILPYGKDLYYFPDAFFPVQDHNPSI